MSRRRSARPLAPAAASCSLGYARRSSPWSSASAPGRRSPASPARWSPSGALEVEGNRQVVQHPIGGVIAAINARDGDEVAAGDVLVRARGRGASSPSSTSSRASGSRSSPARAGSTPSATGSTPSPSTPSSSRAPTTSPEIADLIAAQQQQFDARRKLQGEEAQQLDEQQRQIAKQIDGLDGAARPRPRPGRPARRRRSRARRR